jgi:hypothetical protein
MATAVVEAKKLGAADFTRFCKLIGYDEKSSSIRKLESIGKRYAIFAENIHKLPNTWTTLYLMTKLSDAELKQAFDAGQITRSTTAIKLSETFPKLASHRRQGSNSPSAAHSEVVPNGTNGDELVIKLPSVPNDHQLARLREMLKWLQEEEICVQLGRKVSELLSDDQVTAEQQLKLAA